MSPDIQNDTRHNGSVHSATDSCRYSRKWFTIMVDGTCDLTNTEQMFFASVTLIVTLISMRNS